MTNSEKENPVPNSPKKPGKPKGSSKGGDYEIGYCKPPKEHQFKSGQSGYPKGREKGSGNLALMLEKALRETIPVREGGKIRKMTKAEAMIQKTMNKAMQGDQRAFTTITRLAEKAGLIEKINSLPGPGNIVPWRREFTTEEWLVLEEIRLGRRPSPMADSEDEGDQDADEPPVTKIS